MNVVIADDDFGQEQQHEVNFVANMRRLREESGWSQGELARKMQEAGWKAFHQTTVSRIEAGSRPVRVGEALAIAAVLESNVATMLRPPVEVEALKKLQDAVREVSNLDSQLRYLINDYPHLQSQVMLALEQVEEMEWTSDPAEIDPSVVEARRVAVGRAKNYLGLHFQDLVEAHFKEGQDGVDSEEA